MASALYTSFKADLLTAGLDLIDDATISAVLIDTADETFAAADDFLNDITGAGIVGTAVALGSKTNTGGVFDAADTTLTSVTGDPSEAILIYQHTGVSSTAKLAVWIDGITVTPNGGNITIAWDNGANKIFAFS